MIDAQSVYLDHLRLLPICLEATLLGRLLFEGVRVLPAAVIVLAAGIALGAEMDGSVLHALAIFGLVAFWAMGWNGLFNSADGMAPNGSPTLEYAGACV